MPGQRFNLFFSLPSSPSSPQGLRSVSLLVPFLQEMFSSRVRAASGLGFPVCLSLLSTNKILCEGRERPSQYSVCQGSHLCFFVLAADSGARVYVRKSLCLLLSRPAINFSTGMRKEHSLTPSKLFSCHLGVCRTVLYLFSCTTQRVVPTGFRPFCCWFHVIN